MGYWGKFISHIKFMGLLVYIIYDSTKKEENRDKELEELFN